MSTRTYVPSTDLYAWLDAVDARLAAERARWLDMFLYDAVVPPTVRQDERDSINRYLTASTGFAIDQAELRLGDFVIG